MIVLVDDEGTNQPTGRRFRNAPPVANNIGGKEWDNQAPTQRRQLNAYDANAERGGGLRPETSGVTRTNSFVPGQARGAPPEDSMSRKHTGASGDVSEFSFQLK